MRAILLNSCALGINEKTILKVSRVTPILFSHCGYVKFLNNQTPSGILVQGAFTPPSPLSAQPVNELSTDSEVAILLSM